MAIRTRSRLMTAPGQITADEKVRNGHVLAGHDQRMMSSVIIYRLPGPLTPLHIIRRHRAFHVMMNLYPMSYFGDVVGNASRRISTREVSRRLYRLSGFHWSTLEDCKCKFCK